MCKIPTLPDRNVFRLIDAPIRLLAASCASTSPPATAWLELLWARYTKLRPCFRQRHHPKLGGLWCRHLSLACIHPCCARQALGQYPGHRTQPRQHPVSHTTRISLLTIRVARHLRTRTCSWMAGTIATTYSLRNTSRLPRQLLCSEGFSRPGSGHR